VQALLASPRLFKGVSRIGFDREPDIAVAGQRLGRLGRDVGLAEVRDERVAVRMEVGVETGVVAVGKEVAAIAPAKFLAVFCLVTVR